MRLFGSSSVLAPAGGFPSVESIVKARKLLAQKKEVACRVLMAALCKRYAASSAHCYSSGKEALYRLFSALKRRLNKSLVVVSAYTCPDIACAAIRAGLKVYPLDISEQTLEMAEQKLSADVLQDTAAIVLSNLFGLVDKIEPWLDFKSKEEFVLIDDACQAAFSSDSSGCVGARGSCYGVLSFGRGKAICSIGGGALLVPEGDGLGLKPERKQEVTVRPIAEAVGYMRSYLYWLFEKPGFYGKLASIPGLGLGKTKAGLDFQLRPELSTWQCVSALAQLEQAEITSNTHLANAHRWEANLEELPLVQPFIERRRVSNQHAVPMRYPIIFESKETRDRAWQALSKQGLGVSRSYMQPLTGFATLKHYLTNLMCPVAEQVACRILTLPVHRYVQDEHIGKTVAIIKQCL